MNKSLLTANSILLILSNIYLTAAIVTSIDLGSMAKRALESAMIGLKPKRFGTEVKRYSKVINVKMTPAEKIGVIFIERSNIKRYIPFFNLKTLISVCLLSLILIILPIVRTVRFLPSAIIASAIFSFWPLAILDVMGKYNAARIRRKLSSFISILSRWCAVKEDIFYAFEKSLGSGIEEPLKSFVSDMVIQVKRGIEPERAIEMLRIRVENSQFADFIINVKQCIKSRGDIRKLLGNLEDQFYKIEEEYNRRKISTYKDRIVIYVVMVAVLAISWFLLCFNPQIQDFYLDTDLGRLLLGIFSIVYSVGVYFTLSIGKYKY